MAFIKTKQLQTIADLRVLGNTSGSTASPSQVVILDEDNFASNSATALATQQSIKAYVDANGGGGGGSLSITDGSNTDTVTVGTDVYPAPVLVTLIVRILPFVSTDPTDAAILVPPDFGLASIKVVLDEPT